MNLWPKREQKALMRMTWEYARSRRQTSATSYQLTALQNPATRSLKGLGSSWQAKRLWGPGPLEATGCKVTECYLIHSGITSIHGG